MEESQKAVWTIMVPCNYNDGKPVRTRHHREWDRQVQLITHGMTIGSPSIGKWKNKNDSVEYRDRVIPVMLIATAEEMKKISKITANHYKQIAVMYFKTSSEVVVEYFQ